MLDHLNELAHALRCYEVNPFDQDNAETVDSANEKVRTAACREAEANGPALALVAVVTESLDDSGFRFIPAARVLCAAVLEGFQS